MNRRGGPVALPLLAAAAVLASCGDSTGSEEGDILKISSHCAEGWELVLVR